MDPDHPVAGKGDGMLIDSAGAEMIDAFLEASTGEAGLGTAVGRAAPARRRGRAGPPPSTVRPARSRGLRDVRGRRDARAGGEPVVEAQVSGVKEALAPYDHGSMYLDFASGPSRAASSTRTSTPDRRLQSIKAAYDAGEVIQSNHPIAPAR